MILVFNGVLRTLVLRKLTFFCVSCLTIGVISQRGDQALFDNIRTALFLSAAAKKATTNMMVKSCMFSPLPYNINWFFFVLALSMWARMYRGCPAICTVCIIVVAECAQPPQKQQGGGMRDGFTPKRGKLEAVLFWSEDQKAVHDLGILRYVPICRDW